MSLSPVRKKKKSSYMSDWVEPELTLNAPGDQASTERAEWNGNAGAAAKRC